MHNVSFVSHKVHLKDYEQMWCLAMFQHGTIVISLTYILQDYFIGPGQAGGRLNKKDGLTRYGNSHVKDKTS